LIFGASGVFLQLRDALDTIWNVQRKRKSGIKGLILDRFLSVAAVLGIGFLMLVTLIFDAAIAAIGSYLNQRFSGAGTILEVLQLVVSFGIVTLLFATIFRYLPQVRPAWHDVWPAALLTAILFIAGKFGLGFYLGRAAFASSFGAAGSLVVLLVWIYWSAQIMFFGAEFSQVYSRTKGSMAGDKSKEVAAAEATRVEDR